VERRKLVSLSSSQTAMAVADHQSQVAPILSAWDDRAYRSVGAKIAAEVGQNDP
jgi:hypothetical protein